jgi:hypothetical protein
MLTGDESYATLLWRALDPRLQLRLAVAGVGALWDRGADASAAQSADAGDEGQNGQS